MRNIYKYNALRVSIFARIFSTFLSRKSKHSSQVLKTGVQTRCGINLARYSDHSLFPRIFPFPSQRRKKKNRSRNTSAVRVLPAHARRNFRGQVKRALTHVSPTRVTISARWPLFTWPVGNNCFVGSRGVPPLPSPLFTWLWICIVSLRPRAQRRR